MQNYRARAWQDAVAALDRYAKNSGLNTDRDRQGALYLARAERFMQAENMPTDTIVVDVIPDARSTYSARVGWWIGSEQVFIRLPYLPRMAPGCLPRCFFRGGHAKAAGDAGATNINGPSGALFQLVWRAAAIEKAAENLQWLGTPPPPALGDLALAMLLPRNQAQKQNLGLGHWSAQDQQRVWASVGETMSAATTLLNGIKSGKNDARFYKGAWTKEAKLRRAEDLP